MNIIQKSEAIKAGLRKSFQDDSSKMARRKCYGYEVDPNSELTVNPEETKVVRWIFERYLAGDSLGKIVAGLEQPGGPSPTGRVKWTQEVIDKLLSNKICTGRVLLQKIILVQFKLKTMASWSGISIPEPMRPLFLMRCSWQYRGKSKNGATHQKIRLIGVHHSACSHIVFRQRFVRLAEHGGADLLIRTEFLDHRQVLVPHPDSP